MTLKIEDFKFILKNPKNILIGAIAQFTIMPLIAFLITKIFLFPPEIAIGIILVGACPGGTSSNVISFAVYGELATPVCRKSFCAAAMYNVDIARTQAANFIQAVDIL